ncbi:MAG: ABC transporter ATP-binding protein/permease [Lachnospiraceae bacterium]|nr:ABC transporter ATP-binding protein/permease [Lachnospiraceae bacterium]
MKKLLKYLSSYKKESLLSPLFKMLEASFELFVPLVIAAMIDKGIGDGITEGGDTGYLIKSFVILIALGIVGLISAVSAQYFAAKAATGFATGLRHDLFKHIMNLGFDKQDEAGVSTIITRMTSDVNTTQNGVNMFLRLFLRSPFIVIGAAVMAFTIDAEAALVFVGVLAVLSLVIGLIMKANIPMLMKVQKGLDKVLKLTRENLSGVRVIRAFSREEKECELFSENNDKLSRLQLVAGRVSGLLNPLTYIIINLAIVVLIKVGGVKVNSGVLSTGEVVALYNYMSQILVELIKFAGLMVTINKALASANRISEVFDISEEIQKDTDDSNIADAEILKENRLGIEFKNVSLRYQEGSDESLSNVSFKINPGQTLGVIGGTGSGKTSLINLIPGFYRATEGEILINGHNVNCISKSELRKKIGIVMQKAVLFEGTIRDNLLWGNDKASDEEILKAVDIAVATDVVNSKGGLDAHVDSGGHSFSGGQRQRLSIARALVRKPAILILDDSSSALDFATDLKLRTNIAGLDYNPTTVIVAQRSSSVMNADLIVVLDDGDVVGMGTHEELLQSCEVYQEIYNTQFRREED